MAKARAIVKRLKAVRNIRKITRTMELIATARFKRAMDRATEAAAYTRKISEIVADVSRTRTTFTHPLLEQRAEERRAVLLILTSNRGMCGGYNHGVLREGLDRLQQLRAAGTEVSLEVSGRRGLSFLRFRGEAVAASFTTFEDRPRFDEVEPIAQRYIAEFVKQRLDRVDVAYMRFESASRQRPAVETLLPIGRLDGAEQSESDGRQIDYEFLPSAQEILEEIVPTSFKARLFKCFLDAAVSEQIFRMVAMKAATENADEMLRSLSQQYNRARQTQITSELSEIIGGAAALE